MRRVNRRTGGAVSPLENRIHNLNPYSFIEADYYTVDGVTSKVASFPDKVRPGTGIKVVDATHSLVQATDARQCAVPSAESLLGGKLAATFTAQTYVSSAAASAWNLLHSGAGAEVFLTFVPTNVAATKTLFTTRNTSGTVEGAQVFLNGSQIAWQANNGAGTTFSRTASYGTTIVANTAAYVSVFYTEGASPETGIYLKAVLGGSGASALAPSTNDAYSTLVLGSHVDFSQAAAMKFASLIVFARTLSAADRTAVQAYIAAKYGVV